MSPNHLSVDAQSRPNGSVTRQAVRFGVVGVAGLIFDVGGFNALRDFGPALLHDYPISAKIISSVAGATVSWLGNRYWTFRRTRRANMRQELFVFALVSIIGILISTACLAVSHYLLGLHTQLADNVSGNGIGLILATLFRFWAYQHHVFVSEQGLPIPDVDED